MLQAPRDEYASNMPKTVSKSGSFAHAACPAECLRGDHAAEHAPPWPMHIPPPCHTLPHALLLQNRAPELPHASLSLALPLLASPSRSAPSCGYGHHCRMAKLLHHHRSSTFEHLVALHLPPPALPSSPLPRTPLPVLSSSS